MPAAQASATAAANSGGTAAPAGPEATATQQQLQQRLVNTTASLPIVYGSIAFYLGKKADELQTHEWTLFLRGPNQHEDHLNSLVISKVVFQLHPSFAQPTRELTEPPYEVTERGWGEFEAQIRIHWKDPSEQTTIVNHTIKLYPQGTSAKNEQSMEVPVVAETYDEVVFTDPTESFFRSLTQITGLPPAEEEAPPPQPSFPKKSSRNSSAKLSWKDHLHTVYSDREDFLALIAAQKFLQDELAGVKQRFALVTDELTTVDQKLLQAQQQKQREAAAAAVRGGERKRTKKKGAAPSNKKARTGGGSKSTTTASSSTTPKRAVGRSTTKATTTASKSQKGGGAAKKGNSSASSAVASAKK